MGQNMAIKPGRLSEADLQLAVLQILATYPDGRASVGTLVKRLPEYVKLSEGDRVASDTRPNEAIWEQQVRNLKSHHKTFGNIFAEGFVVQSAKGEWEITEAGRLHLKT